MKIVILYIFLQLYANGIIVLWFIIDETSGKNKDFVLLFYCSFLIDPKNGGSVLLHSVCKNSPVDMMSHPRRLESSLTTLCEPKFHISQLALPSLFACTNLRTTNRDCN
jgi:hypothetical protein